MIEEATQTARRLVEERYPQARAAWLGGSIARGAATATSDLDITVLLPGPPAPLRESIRYADWPVELFVHTEASLAHYCDKDRQRRQPSMMRLVGETIVLLDTDGSGARLQATGKAQLLAGPPPLPRQDIDMLRYKISDLLEDLIGANSNDVRTVVASVLWQEAATLLLTGANHWAGTGKGLLRELAAYDATHTTDYATALPAAVRAAADGNSAAMITAVDTILEPYGGRLFAGYHLSGD
ncbi:nucleotidyltransferase domain-containing protein [Kribbella sp. NBC_00382]|uniref:nucleotidyltransferase domain-containing protein n=1 Tax=Kribbella sp. NBC_00382 TaxID=2975967 RepID=UPI002E1A0FAD